VYERSLPRYNKYPATCVACGKRVPCGEGTVKRTSGESITGGSNAWEIHHIDCSRWIVDINTSMCILKDGCTPNMCPCDLGERFYHNKKNPAVISREEYLPALVSAIEDAAHDPFN
jgi:hypothetical protein